MALGIYGVMTYQTARRTREIGIRVAVGAARGQVLRLVLGEGWRLVAAGLVLGVPLALGAGCHDVAALRRGPVVGARARPGRGRARRRGIGRYVRPAWRATRVNPMTALRDT